MKRINLKLGELVILLIFVLSLNLLAAAQTKNNKPLAAKFCQALGEKQWEQVKQMISQGANIEETRHGCYQLPLQYAAMYENLEMVNLMLAKGAKVNTVDQSGQTALLKAVEFTKSWCQQCKESKSEYEASNRNPIAIIRALLEAGADPNIHSDGDSPLGLAADNNILEVVNLLLEKAKVDSANGTGETALYQAVRHLFAKSDPEVVRVLLKAGADPNMHTLSVKDCFSTPLIVATLNNDISIIKILLENGADPNAVDNHAHNAYMIAVLTKKSDLADLLKPVTKNLISVEEAKRAKLTGKFFKSNEGEIYYEQHGAKTGTPLFVLHGGPGFDHQYFLANSTFDEIGKDRPVIFYDQRGAGYSSFVNKDDDVLMTNLLAKQIEDLENLRKYLGYEKIDLAGHSWGGFLAMAYAVKYPQNIAHLILIDSMSPEYANTPMALDTYPELYREFHQRISNAGWGRSWYGPREDELRLGLIAYMNMLFHSPEKRDAFIAGSTDFTYNLGLNNALNKSAEQINLTGELPKLKMPTLILHGKDDFNINYFSSENIQKLIPNSQLVMFEESGHLPFYEEPEKFVTVVQNFLKK